MRGYLVKGTYFAMTKNQHLRVQMDLTACLCTNLYIKVWEFRQASNFVSLVCSRYFSVGCRRLTVIREIQRYHYLSYWTTVAVLCIFTGNMYLPQYFFSHFLPRPPLAVRQFNKCQATIWAAHAIIRTTLSIFFFISALSAVLTSDFC